MKLWLKALTLTIGLVLLITVAPASARPGNGGGNGGNGGSGGNGGGASIWVDEGSYAGASGSSGQSASATDPLLLFGQEMQFGYETSYTDNRGRGPWIELRCEQDGEVVYREWRAAFDGGYMYGEPFNLGPSLAWTDGDADCSGLLGHYSKNFSKFMVDATVDFHVTDFVLEF